MNSIRDQIVIFKEYITDENKHEKFKIENSKKGKTIGN